MDIQLQNWFGFSRALITTDGASAILDIFPFNRGRQLANGNSDSYLRNLWVDKEHRGKGIARNLIAEAEAYAASHRCKTIALQHDDREAPMWVRKWYNRRGYQVVERTRNQVLMRKKL